MLILNLYQVGTPHLSQQVEIILAEKQLVKDGYYMFQVYIIKTKSLASHIMEGNGKEWLKNLVEGKCQENQYLPKEVRQWQKIEYQFKRK